MANALEQFKQLKSTHDRLTKCWILAEIAVLCKGSTETLHHHLRWTMATKVRSRGLTYTFLREVILLWGPHMGAPHPLHELEIHLPLSGGDLLFEVLLQLG